MKYLNKYELFIEALQPSIAKRYIKHFNRERYQKLFQTYKEKYDGDKNAYRLYLPLVEPTEPTIGEVEAEIDQFLSSFDYEIVNYITGQCKHKGAKNLSKIGQVLTNIAKKAEKDGDDDTQDEAERLLKDFTEDPLRKAGSHQELIVCISRHPYDIAGSDTDRAWTNCMTLPHEKGEGKQVKLKKLRLQSQNLQVQIEEVEELGEDEEAFQYLGITEDDYEEMKNKKIKIENEIKDAERRDEQERHIRGQNTKYLICDVKEGSLISYLIKKDDKNIKNPLACLNIKPYIDEDDPNNIILLSDENTYPNESPKIFKETVDDWLKEINKDRKGLYNINPKLYVDSDYGTIIRMKAEDIQDRINNCQTLDQLTKFINKIESDSELINQIKVKPDVISKLADDASIEDLYNAEGTFDQLLKGSRKYSWTSLMKKKLEDCKAEDLPVGIYNDLQENYSQFIEILKDKKFVKFEITLEIHQAIEDDLSTFLYLLKNNPTYLKYINFFKIDKGTPIKGSPGNYIHEKSDDYPEIIKKNVDFNNHNREYWLFGSYSNNQENFDFYLSTPEHVKLAKEAFKVKEPVKPKTVRKPRAKKTA